MIIKNIYLEKNFAQNLCDIRIKNGIITEIGRELQADYSENVLNGKEGIVLPLGIDCHIHLREPGFTHKETILTGTRSAAKGGIGAVMAMANTKPTPDNEEKLDSLLNKIKNDAVVDVYPFAPLTIEQKGKELVDIEKLSQKVLAFSDDGVGVNDTGLLKEAMERVKQAKKIISSHAEADEKDSRKAEWKAVEREIKLASDTKVKYHFCHMSVKESFELIKDAKKNGVDITAEVAPHHLILIENDINNNTNFKMNPPLRSEKDREAAVEALFTGVADFVATDHAPHTESEKAAPYEKAPNGIIGLETMFPLIYTHFVKRGLCSLQELINLTSGNASKRFGIPSTEVSVGEMASFTILDSKNQALYTKEEILSKSVNSPFIGQKMFGKPIFTISKGKIIYSVIGGEK